MTSGRHVTREHVLAFRLDGHGLSKRRPLGDLLAVAGACGIRNTPPGSAVLALHARLTGVTLDTLNRALTDEKSLVEVLSVRISPLLVPTPDAATFTLGALPGDEESLRGVLTNHVKVLDEAGISATAALERAAAVAHAELAGGMMARGALIAPRTAKNPDRVRKFLRACE